MKRLAFFGFVLAAIFGFCPQVSAFSLVELIGPEIARSLLAGEKPVASQFKDCAPQLVPSSEVLEALAAKLCRDLNPSVMVETLFLYRKPPGAEKEALSAEEETRLYNAALALSTLAGLEYYSASRGQMRTFYESSHLIDGPSTKRIIPDPVFTRPPAELTIYASQKDLSFGNNIYQYDYYLIAGGLVFIQQNLTSLNYGIIPAVGKNKLHSLVAVMDAEDCLLVYIASIAKTASLPGMKERIGDSFSNRAEAVFNWFSNQADKAFNK